MDVGGGIMCGRFILGVVREELERLVDEYYGIGVLGADIAVPRYNVAPGQDVVAVLGDGIRNRIGLLRWGFVPWFAKEEKGGYAMINARSETVLDKPVYAQSLAAKRCVILADGFYEWKKDGTGRRPMRIFLKESTLFAMAGLWSAWARPDGSKLFSCTILTTSANALVAPIHDRMPVILMADAQKLWLGPETHDLALLSRLLVPCEAAAMGAHEVSARVNDAHNEGPDLILPV